MKQNNEFRITKIESDLVFDESCKFLKGKFNKEFKISPREYTSEDFTLKYNIFADDILIGSISNPLEMACDIAYMFNGFGTKNDYFYEDVIKPMGIELPDEYKTVDDLVDNEIRELYYQQIKMYLSKAQIEYD